MCIRDRDYLQYASLTDGQKEEIERYISLEPKDERMASWQAKVKEQYACLLYTSRCV